MAKVFTGLMALVVLGGGMWSTACTSNDTEGDGGGGTFSPSSSSSSSGSSGRATGRENEDRPAFDASFSQEQDANVDPTPDGGDTCVDNDDPGSAENVAKQLGETSDCSSAGTKTVKGVMSGAVDVDFYKLSMKDELGFTCQVDPDIGSPTSGLELCVYARCKNSTQDAVTGCKQGVENTNTIGMKGCCATTPGKAIPKWDCAGITDDDSADFVVRVKQAAGGDKCLPYTFTYTF